MNERIEKLLKKAQKITAENHAPGGRDYEREIYSKFAELIVAECAKFCDEVIKEVEIAMEQCEMVRTSDRLMMLHDGTINGALMSKYRFKKHFGVE